MRIGLAEHLKKEDRIKLGSYYTPQILVKRVFDFIRPYLVRRYKREIVILDSAGGCGAFMVENKCYEYRIADSDKEACLYLEHQFNKSNIFHTNSLLDVCRDKFKISANSFLVMVGNPPYNDTTSEFKNGEKGLNLCDDDLFDRDLGVSFMKSYDKLKADIVCVLHPLSYLIKKTNFERLKSFKANYRLIKGEIFSSALFQGTGTGKFPIIVALYERHSRGMDYNYIRQFQFDILGETKKFVLSDYNTTDGYINKYPPRKNDLKEPPLGLFYYTFRDLNSLRKNTSFFTKPHPNGIVVTLENYYQYAYLFAFKTLFQPPDLWLYGNLSPLVDIEDLENNKSLYVAYALNNHKIFKEISATVVKKIAYYYSIESLRENTTEEIEKAIIDKLSLLTNFTN